MSLLLKNLMTYLEANEKYIGEKEIGEIIGVVQKSVNSQLMGDKLSKVTKIAHDKQFGEKILVCYTDGSFDEKNNMSGSGAILFEKGKEDNVTEIMDSMEDTYGSRNITGETKAVILALKKAIKWGYRSIELHYDYTGIEQWARGNWKTKKQISKDYVGDYSKLVREYNLNVEFFWIKGHSGDKYNEMVDKVAKKSIGLL